MLATTKHSTVNRRVLSRQGDPRQHVSRTRTLSAVSGSDVTASRKELSPQLVVKEPTDSSATPTTTAGATSRCPFLHETGLRLLEHASTSTLKIVNPNAEEHAALSGGSDMQLPSGPGWAALGAGQRGDLPSVQGRFCWNPILGEMMEVESNGLGPFLLERFKQFGPVFSWQLGSQKLHTVLDYDAIRSLLQHDGKVVQAWNPESMYAMLGESTRTNMENPSARLHVRKLLAPGFSPSALGGYLDKMANIVSTQLDEWVAAGAVDLSREGKVLSFEFSTQLLVDFAVPREQKAQLRQKFDRLFNGMMAAPIQLPGTKFSCGIKARQELIEDVKALLKQNNSNSSSNSSGGGSGEAGQGHSKTSVFDHMLEANKYLLHTDQLSEDEVAASGISLIIAGNDTSGIGMTGLLGLVPMVPGVMENLREEQDQLVARHGPQLTRAVLESMPYADAVIKEVLRFTPPAASLFRKTLCDMQVAGRYVPAGSILYLSFFIAQLVTDPRLKANSSSQVGSSSSSQPDVSGLAQTSDWLQDLPANHFHFIGQETLAAHFKPERWLAGPTTPSSAGGSEESGLSKPSGLLTFGQGPHMCLGQNLFMMEARVLLAILARHYTLQFDHPELYAVKMGFIPQPNSHCMLQVGRRE